MGFTALLDAFCGVSHGTHNVTSIVLVTNYLRPGSENGSSVTEPIGGELGQHAMQLFPPSPSVRGITCWSVMK